MAKFQNEQCYARELGGCSQEVDREHYLSECVLELIEHHSNKESRSVRVRGLAFQQPGEVKRLGVGGLSARILCVSHHSQLSRFDSAGKAMFTAMDRLNQGAGDSIAPHQTVRVDGDRLERWMLKAFLGGLYSGNYRVTATDGMEGVCPPRNLLDILFKEDAFPQGQGLYWMPPKTGEDIIADQAILQVEVLGTDDGQHVSGFRVWFFGFEFSLLIAGLTPGVPTMFDNACYRPAGLQVVGSNVHIDFNWKNGPKSKEIVLHHVKPSA